MGEHVLEEKVEGSAESKAIANGTVMLPTADK